MAAESEQAAAVRRAALGPGLAVVQVAVLGRAAAVGRAAGAIPGADEVGLSSGGRAAGGAVGEQAAVAVSDAVTPGGFGGLVEGDLSGDVGGYYLLAGTVSPSC